MSTIVSVFSERGGVGKTTLTALLGYVLAKDRRVCLIDLDLTAPALGQTLGLRFDQGILDYITSEVPITRDQFVHPVELSGRQLHLAPGRFSPETIELVRGYLLADIHAGMVTVYLEKLIAEELGDFDIILFDNPSGLMNAGIGRVITELAGGAEIYLARSSAETSELRRQVDEVKAHDDRWAGLKRKPTLRLMGFCTPGAPSRRKDIFHLPWQEIIALSGSLSELDLEQLVSPELSRLASSIVERPTT